MGSVLAYSGIPDAGKSVMWCVVKPATWTGQNVLTLHDSSIVCDYLCTQFLSEETACVCLYCDYRDYRNQTPVNMIGVLLKHSITQQSGIITFRYHLYIKKASQRTERHWSRWSISIVWGNCQAASKALCVHSCVGRMQREPPPRVDTITSGDFKRM